jgi:hypothetical protein
MKRFEKGDKVLYVPYHAGGETSHPDVEKGVVTSIGRFFIFVKFEGEYLSKACKANQLYKVI